MARQIGKWQRALSEFATDYLVPVLGMFVLIIVGLGILGVTGWILRQIVLPVFVILVVLAVAALLTAELSWRLLAFNALVGIGSTFFAVLAFSREPFQTVVGIAIGSLCVLSLHLYGEPMKASQKEVKTIVDAKGNQFKAVLLKGDEFDFNMLSGIALGLIIPLFCWVLRDYGAWSLFLGLYASLALGRAISWIAVESDTKTAYFWQPFSFLKKLPGFSHLFRWWHEIRQFLGTTVAHWAQE
ncbi:MAG: hypothetical protein NZ805_07790 [Armatimonadetes bacterium]|nr:hypothetical protein [Armatimonadota bacterium]MDW8027031.1 hypothetical protein [Armatimonadota bacterium]